MATGRNRIRELRGLRGLSLQQIADHLKVSDRTVRRWELREYEIPRKHWEPLAGLFRVQVPWLLGIENGNNDGDNGERAEAAA